MIEGIIQKVTDKYLDKLHNDVTYDGEVAMRLMQQELMAEIKKCLDEHYAMWHIQKGCSLQFDLIGDTE